MAVRCSEDINSIDLIVYSIEYFRTKQLIRAVHTSTWIAKNPNASSAMTVWMRTVGICTHPMFDLIRNIDFHSVIYKESQQPYRIWLHRNYLILGIYRILPRFKRMMAPGMSSNRRFWKQGPCRKWGIMPVPPLAVKYEGVGSGEASWPSRKILPSWGHAMTSRGLGVFLVNCIRSTSWHFVGIVGVAKAHASQTSKKHAVSFLTVVYHFSTVVSIVGQP